MPVTYTETEQYHSDEMQDIISAPPSWLIRWGMSLFFGVLVMIVGLSAFIRYPDVVKTQLVINSANSPKPIMVKQSGKVIQILVSENQEVNAGQVLAYMESTADHSQVLDLLKNLKDIQAALFGTASGSFTFLNTPTDLKLGEIQGSYQSFFQSYLAYKSSVADGFYLKKKAYLQKDLQTIQQQKDQLLAQKQLQEKEYAIAENEYRAHQKLAEQKVIAQLELKRMEGQFLSKKYPLQQTEAAFITNSSSYSSKQKEIMELDNQIQEERSKFIQALSSLISEIESWKSQYILSASQPGKLAYAGIVQENQFVQAGKEIFYVNPGNTDFFGEMTIPQYNMGKVEKGQEVLVKLQSYPYEEYGILRARIGYVAEVPYKDSVFISKVMIDSKGILNMKRPVKLRNGMLAQAEIITEDASLMKRLLKSLIRITE